MALADYSSEMFEASRSDASRLDAAQKLVEVLRKGDFYGYNRTLGLMCGSAILAGDNVTLELISHGLDNEPDPSVNDQAVAPDSVVFTAISEIARAALNTPEDDIYLMAARADEEVFRGFTMVASDQLSPEDISKLNRLLVGAIKNGDPATIYQFGHLVVNSRAFNDHRYKIPAVEALIHVGNGAWHAISY